MPGVCVEGLVGVDDLELPWKKATRAPTAATVSAERLLGSSREQDRLKLGACGTHGDRRRV